MNKLVYLYELDSTRISPWEIDRGRKALYEEIVMRGNRVVLTFQQLTDSKIFLELLKIKKILKLLHLYLKMERYDCQNIVIYTREREYVLLHNIFRML